MKLSNLVFAIGVMFANNMVAGDTFNKYVDPKGNINLPENFSTDFSHLGSFSVTDDKKNTDIHNVYTTKDVIEHYLKTGEFKDGAVLIKDVGTTKSEPMTTGNVSYKDKTKVIFVMVKDAKNRFKDNPLWGNTWGWAMFDGNNTKKQLAKNYETDCLSCHIPAKDTDWVYTKTYDILKK